MPYVTGDLVRIEDVQLIAAQTVRNVYFYSIIATSGDVTGPEILTAFNEQLVSDILPLQALGLTHTLLKIDNVTDGLSFGELALSGRAGLSTGDAMPTYVAFSFKLLRASKLTRNGFKRIAGPTEPNVAGNFVTSTFASSTAVSDAVTALGADLTVVGIDGTADLRPHIASRPVPPNTQYVSQPVAGVEFQTAITSQVSRKFGRGE